MRSPIPSFGDGHSVNALVVDDSAVMRKVLIGALARLDITEVDQASNGLEALVLASKQPYDVILMDWNMPNLNGYDTIVKMRALGIESPIVMVTTEAEKTNIIRALKAGANNYVVKPFEPHVLLDKIKATLNPEN